MENLKSELILIASKLNELYIYSKILHWNSSGQNYYSDHLLYDRISDDLHSFIDGLVETCIIPLQKNDEINFNFNDVFSFTALNELSPAFLLDAIVITVKQIDRLSHENLPDGIKTYLTDVSKALLVKAGLLDRRLK